MDLANQEFNQSLEKFIERYGLKKGTMLLQGFLTNTARDSSTKDRQKLIMDYLVLEATHIFEILEEDFFHSSGTMVKAARWACIHLLKEYTTYTNRQIGIHFRVSIRSLKYSKMKCSELLEIRHFEKDFARRYEALEQQLITFIAKTE